MKHPSVIERSAVVWACDCTEINVPCTCGKQPRVKAIEAIKANPTISDRALSAMTGISRQTIGRARATVPDGPVEPRTGLDGKTRRMPIHSSVHANNPLTKRSVEFTQEFTSQLNEWLGERSNISEDSVTALANALHLCAEEFERMARHVEQHLER